MRKIGYTKGLRLELGFNIENKDTLIWVANSLVENFNEKSLNYKNNNTFVRFSLTIPKFVEFCLEKGITPKKSLNLDFKHSFCNEEEKLYFLRGVIDGDGCVFLGNKLCLSRIEISTSSIKFAYYLINTFPEFKITTKIKNRTNPTYGVWVSGSRSKNLAGKLPILN